MQGSLRRTLQLWGKNSMQAVIDLRRNDAGEPDDPATRELQLKNLSKVRSGYEIMVKM